MSYSFFALLGRMNCIDRWGLMRNTRVENIQEHSHMVAVLAHALLLQSLGLVLIDLAPQGVDGKPHGKDPLALWSGIW